jgi:hypothetical protein
MAKYDLAWAAVTNAKVYRAIMADAECRAWAEQATRSAARIAELEAELRVAKGMAMVREITGEANR